MNKAHDGSSNPVLRNLNGLLPDLTAFYKDVHSHPELSMQETRPRVWLRIGFAPPVTK
jgi:hippurate hydrolase